MRPLFAADLERAPERCEIVVIVNPNNPTGTCLPPEALLALHARLARRGGWLVVDEAFVDAQAEASLAPFAARPGLILLRSLGKFFGLAGARVGFVLAEMSLLARLNEALGPWSVSGPARQVATLALRDGAWQRETRARLEHDSARLAALLRAHGLTPAGGCALFQWVRTAAARTWYDALARSGILVRHFDRPRSLRFGLPGDEAQWRRLEHVLASIGRET